MNISRSIIVSFVSFAAASASQAADAIVYAEPEPMEYVRICDVYGAGFFYIPGTETCLQIGGYMRYRMDYVKQQGLPYTFTKTARFAPSFDVRSETEWGTLRGFAHLFFEWNSVDGDDVYADQLFMELQMGNGTLLVGKTDNPYARFFGDYGAPGEFEGDFAGQIYNSGEVSYTYDAGNGFSAVIAAVETGTGLFEPNVEAGAIYRKRSEELV